MMDANHKDDNIHYDKESSLFIYNINSDKEKDEEKYFSESNKYSDIEKNDPNNNELENNVDDVNNDDVLKYYNIVKNNKINDQILQLQIEHLLNFNKKSETYEEKQKRVMLGYLNDDDIDYMLYEKSDEEYLSHFIEDLNNFKNIHLIENFDSVIKNGIIHSINDEKIIYKERRLPDINNMNINNILYYYFYSNQEYLMNIKNRNVYTYDSYVFQNDQMNDLSEDEKYESNSDSESTISDEDLLLLRYDDNSEYEDEAKMYINKKRRKNKRDRKKNKRGKGNKKKIIPVEKRRNHDNIYDNNNYDDDNDDNDYYYKSSKYNDKKKKYNEKLLKTAEPSKMNKEIEAMMNKANNYYINQNFNECIILLEKVIKKSPCLHDPFHLLGLIYEREYKNLKKAINYYLIAAHLSHGDFLSWYNIIDLCKIAKEYNVVIYCLYKVLKFYKRKKYKCKKKFIEYDENNECKDNQNFISNKIMYDNVNPHDSTSNMYDNISNTYDNMVWGNKEINTNNRNNNVDDNKKIDCNNKKNEYSLNNQFDNFMRHIYFNLAFTYILLEDYKNALKNLFILKNNNYSSYDLIIDIYICICLVHINNASDCYNFLKNIYVYNILKRKKEENYVYLYQEKVLMCFLMQTQILNNKYDECIFVYKTLTKQNDYVHIDIFLQFIKAVIMRGHMESSYLIKTYFLQITLASYHLFEDIIYSLGDTYYLKNMFEGAIYFYTLIYKKKKRIYFENIMSIKNEKKPNTGHNEIKNNMNNKMNESINDCVGINVNNNPQNNHAYGWSSYLTTTLKNDDLSKHPNFSNIYLENEEMNNMIYGKVDNIIWFDNKINFIQVIYKLVKSYYYIENYIKAEKIILKILNNEHIEKNNIEIDLKTLYIDILYKLKKYNESINVLLSIREKKLRFICSIPKPLNNKEREILLLKILNKKNKLLLYTQHNNYILHIFYIYQQNKNYNTTSYQYDNYLLNKDINDIIQIQKNICFCYFCVKYNFILLNYIYLYNIFNILYNNKIKSSSFIKNKQILCNLYKFRKYLQYLTSSFSILKKGKKVVYDWNIIHKNFQLIETKLFYKGVMIIDIKNVINDKNKNKNKNNGYDDVNCYDNGNANGYDNGNANGYDNGNVNGYDNDNVNGYDNGNVNGYDNGNVNCYDNGNVNCYDNGNVNCYDNGNVNCYDNGNVNCYDNGDVNCYDNGQDHVNQNKNENKMDKYKKKEDVEEPFPCAQELSSGSLINNNNDDHHFNDKKNNVIIEEFYNNIYKYKCIVESEILNSKIIMKFYKFSYNFFYLLYEMERDFNRIQTYMEKENLNFRSKNIQKKNDEMNKKKNNEYDDHKRSEEASSYRKKIHMDKMDDDDDYYYYEDDYFNDKYSDKENDHNHNHGNYNYNYRHVNVHLENIEKSLINKTNTKNMQRYRRISFLLTKKRLNFFSFESYLGLYFSLLFLEECFFLISIMNLYEDSIHILSVYLRNRKSNKMKSLTYFKSIKNEFKKYHINNNLLNLNFYFFDNVYTNNIRNEIKNEYCNLKHINKYIDCKYYIFRINLLLNKLYISAGNYEKQIKCLNDIYIFNKKQKEEYKILKYYSDIVLTGKFCHDFLTSISKSKNKNILISFRLFLVRSIHYKKSNPFLLYLIGHICNISCMITNAVHEFTRAYTFLLKNKRENKERLDNFRNQDAKWMKKNKHEMVNEEEEQVDDDDDNDGDDNDGDDNDGDDNDGEDNDGEDNDGDDNDGEDNDGDDNDGADNDRDDEKNGSEEFLCDYTYNRNMQQEKLITASQFDDANSYENSDKGNQGEYDDNEDRFLFADLKLSNNNNKEKDQEYINSFENICDNINFLFSLTVSYFNYSSCFRVENRESVIMTSFCLLNEYIYKRYEQKILNKKKKYKKYSLFYKIYKYIYLAEILYNLARALHHLSYYNECMKLYLTVIDLIKAADKEILWVIKRNNLNINEKFIYNYVINMNKCMCFTCLNFSFKNNKSCYNKLINYFLNLNTKYSNFYLLFFDKKHLLFSASYNLSVIFRKFNRFEQAKYILNNIIWD
ncbi:conserved Plasmodium protein, unknown function [Plasmodium sp. gorilla clade G3]|nr:conserved Plasmodium protein, unknown function [Plasmodium sp. gorilla clade G3]